MTEPHVPGVAGRPRRRALIAWLATAAVVVVGAALAFAYQPWLNPWWPTRHEAAALPSSCPDLPGMPAPSTGLPTPTAGENFVGADCQWGSAGSNEFPPLTARYSLFQRNGDHGAIEEAQLDAATRITRFQGSQGYALGADTPVSGVGDEARITSHGSLVILVARKANVVLNLEYNASSKTDNAQIQAITASSARALLDLVNLS